MKALLFTALLSTMSSVLSAPFFSLASFLYNKDQPSAAFPYKLGKNEELDRGGIKLAGKVCGPMFKDQDIHTYGDASIGKQKVFRAGIAFKTAPDAHDKFGKSILGESACAACLKVTAGYKVIKVYVVDEPRKNNGTAVIEVGAKAFKDMGGVHGTIQVSVEKIDDSYCWDVNYDESTSNIAKNGD